MLGLSSNLLGIGFTLGSTAARVAVASTVMSVSVTGVTIATVGPVFSDTEMVSADAFSAGTLDITASPASAALSVSAMAPGDYATGEITLVNTGSLQARYSMRLISSESRFASVLQMTIKADVASCDNDGFFSSGEILYGPGIAGAVDGIPAFGDPAPGPDPGDRLLNPASEEVLCVNVLLPISTDNALQNASTTVTVEFIAEDSAPQD